MSEGEGAESLDSRAKLKELEEDHGAILAALRHLKDIDAEVGALSQEALEVKHSLLHRLDRANALVCDAISEMQIRIMKELVEGLPFLDDEPESD